MDSELVQALWALLTNPNAVYILLIAGLWAAATAVYVPGTGLPEAAAVILLVLAVAGLTQQPVNVVGVLLIIVGGALFAADIKVQSIAITIGALLCLVLGSLFLFPPAEAAPRVSPWLIGGVAAASLVFFGAILSQAMRVRKLPAKVAPEVVIGQSGSVATRIDPVGTVQVCGELWAATADEVIGVGEEVMVVDIEGLRLQVSRTDTREEAT